MSTHWSLAAVVGSGVVRLPGVRYRRRMVQRISTAVLVSAALCAFCLGAACGGDINPKALNEPCTRTEQCIEGLVCLSGVCSMRDDQDASAPGPTTDSP